MDKKKALKEILDLCKNGNFRDAVDAFDSIDGDVNNKWIMALIIGCCNVCVANNATTGNISDIYLYNFLLRIISHLKNPSEAELLSYFQSLFHILKFFIKKKSYQLLPKMEQVFIPPFLPRVLPKKHCETYESTANLLYNLIVKAEDFPECETLIEICTIISKIYVAVSNTSSLLSMSLNCGVCLSNVSCPIMQQETHYFKVLNLLDNLKLNGEGDFKRFLCYFCLIYQQHLKQYDFMKAAEFFEKSYKRVVKLFEDCDCTNMFLLLKFPLVLSPYIFNNKLETFLECKRSLSDLRSSEKRQLVGNKLHTLIYTVVMSYYKTVNSTDWCKLSEVCRLEFLYFIYDIGRLELLSSYTCSCKCLLDQNVYQAFSYSQYICTLIELCIRQNAVSPNFNKKGANLVEKFCEDIKTLKQTDCERWKKAWNALGMTIYNSGVHLYQNSDQGCLHYIYILIKYFIKFEYSDGLTILKFSIISSAFSVACNCNMKDYKKCMALSALGIKLCVNQRTALMSSWIKSKVSQRDLKSPESTEVQKLTLVSVFTVFQKEMAFLTDGVNLLTSGDKIDLLTFELEQYKTKWKSKVPMMSVLKELCETANLSEIVQVLVNIFGDCELMLHDDVPKIIHDVLKRYETKINSEENSTLEGTIYLAVLYHMNYKYYIKDTIKKNIDDMEKVMYIKPRITDEPPDAIPRDPNEECDIISMYDSLKLSRYFEVMRYLDKSLDLFASVIKDNFDKIDLKKPGHSLLYTLLMKIAFEYRLHRYKVKCLQALQLALKVAQAENNPCNIVSTIGFIIEDSDIKKSYVKYLTLIADKQLDAIEYTSVSNLNVVLTYYICKSKSLMYKDYKEAYRIFQIAQELYDVQEEKSGLMLIESQLHLLHYKFVLLPCKFEVVDHQKSTLLTVHLANEVVHNVYNDSKIDGPYEMSILLDANEELTKLHHLTRCPREVRAYCKGTLILAQQLVLPIRCAYYLVYLAHADLRSSRFDDCQVKMDGLADILCLTKRHMPVDQENKPPEITEVDKDIVNITNEIQEMVLDLPAPKNYRKQFSPSSPTLVIQQFCLPAFMDHGNECDCFYCLSLEYQDLILEKTRLDALLHVKQNNSKIAFDFFHGALKFYDLCSKRYESYTETVARYISYDLIPGFSEEVLASYGFTLLDYGYHLRRCENKPEALKVSKDLVKLVSERKLQHMYLYNDALFQKLSYLTELVVRPDDTKPKKELEMDSLYPEMNSIATTPETKQSKVTLTYQRSPNFSAPKRRIKKCLAFNLSPDEGNAEVVQEKRSPVLVQPKTPAPRIRVYPNDTAEKTKKKSTTAIPIFNDTGKRNKKKLTVHIDSSTTTTTTAVPSTPVFSNPDNPDGGLKIRTRLLTEKLRQSSKKAETTSVPVLDETGVPSGKKKLSSRKNLFDKGKPEKEAVAPQSGAIRKSMRNRNI